MSRTISKVYILNTFTLSCCKILRMAKTLDTWFMIRNDKSFFRLKSLKIVGYSYSIKKKCQGISGDDNYIDIKWSQILRQQMADGWN